MLTCRDVTEVLTDYLEGGLSFLDRLRFQMHLGMCRLCRRYLRQMRLLVRGLGRLPSRPPPPEVWDELLRRFRAWKA